MAAYIVNNSINAFKNKPDCPAMVAELIVACDNILLPLFSTIISLKLFFENQYPYMKHEIESIQNSIIAVIRGFNNNANVAEIGDCDKRIKKLLGEWLTLRYRMDVSVFYFYFGEIPDIDAISIFFKPLITHTNEKNKRPVKIRNYLQGHEFLKDKPWNQCSGYGLMNYYIRLEQGFNILNELIKNHKIRSVEQSQRVEKMKEVYALMKQYGHSVEDYNRHWIFIDDEMSQNIKTQKGFCETFRKEVSKKKCAFPIRTIDKKMFFDKYTMQTNSIDMIIGSLKITYNDVIAQNNNINIYRSNIMEIVKSYENNPNMNFTLYQPKSYDEFKILYDISESNKNKIPFNLSSQMIYNYKVEKKLIPRKTYSIQASPENSPIPSPINDKYNNINNNDNTNVIMESETYREVDKEGDGSGDSSESGHKEEERENDGGGNNEREDEGNEQEGGDNSNNLGAGKEGNGDGDDNEIQLNEEKKFMRDLEALCFILVGGNNPDSSTSLESQNESNAAIFPIEGIKNDFLDIKEKASSVSQMQKLLSAVNYYKIRTNNNQVVDKRIIQYYKRYHTACHYTNKNSSIYNNIIELKNEMQYREKLFTNIVTSPLLQDLTEMDKSSADTNFEIPSNNHISDSRNTDILNFIKNFTDSDTEVCEAPLPYLDTYGRSGYFLYGEEINVTNEGNIDTITTTINNKVVEEYINVDENDSINVNNTYEENDNKLMDLYHIGASLTKGIENTFTIYTSKYIKVYLVKRFDETPNDINLLQLIVETELKLEGLLNQCVENNKTLDNNVNYNLKQNNKKKIIRSTWRVIRNAIIFYIKESEKINIITTTLKKDKHKYKELDEIEFPDPNSIKSFNQQLHYLNLLDDLRRDEKNVSLTINVLIQIVNDESIPKENTNRPISLNLSSPDPIVEVIEDNIAINIINFSDQKKRKRNMIEDKSQESLPDVRSTRGDKPDKFTPSYKKQQKQFKKKNQGPIIPPNNSLNQNNTKTPVVNYHQQFIKLPSVIKSVADDQIRQIYKTERSSLNDNNTLKIAFQINKTVNYYSSEFNGLCKQDIEIIIKSMFTTISKTQVHEIKLCPIEQGNCPIFYPEEEANKYELHEIVHDEANNNNLTEEMIMVEENDEDGAINLEEEIVGVEQDKLFEEENDEEEKEKEKEESGYEVEEEEENEEKEEEVDEDYLIKQENEYEQIYEEEKEEGYVFPNHHSKRTKVDIRPIDNGDDKEYIDNYLNLNHHSAKLMGGLGTVDSIICRLYAYTYHELEAIFDQRIARIYKINLDNGEYLIAKEIFRLSQTEPYKEEIANIKKGKSILDWTRPLNENLHIYNTSLTVSLLNEAAIRICYYDFHKIRTLLTNISEKQLADMFGQTFALKYFKSNHKEKNSLCHDLQNVQSMGYVRFLFINIMDYYTVSELFEYLKIFEDNSNNGNRETLPFPILNTTALEFLFDNIKQWTVKNIQALFQTIDDYKMIFMYGKIVNLLVEFDLDSKESNITYNVLLNEIKNNKLLKNEYNSLVKTRGTQEYSDLKKKEKNEFANFLKSRSFAKESIDIYVNELFPPIAININSQEVIDLISDSDTDSSDNSDIDTDSNYNTVRKTKQPSIISSFDNITIKIEKEINSESTKVLNIDDVQGVVSGDGGEGVSVRRDVPEEGGTYELSENEIEINIDKSAIEIDNDLVEKEGGDSGGGLGGVAVGGSAVVVGDRVMEVVKEIEVPKQKTNTPKNKSKLTPVKTVSIIKRRKDQETELRKKFHEMKSSDPNALAISLTLPAGAIPVIQHDPLIYPPAINKLVPLIRPSAFTTTTEEIPAEQGVINIQETSFVPNIVEENASINILEPLIPPSAFTTTTEEIPAEQGVINTQETSFAPNVDAVQAIPSEPEIVQTMSLIPTLPSEQILKEKLKILTGGAKKIVDQKDIVLMKTELALVYNKHKTDFKEILTRYFGSYIGELIHDNYENDNLNTILEAIRNPNPIPIPLTPKPSAKQEAIERENILKAPLMTKIYKLLEKDKNVPVSTIISSLQASNSQSSPAKKINKKRPPSVPISTTSSSIEETANYSTRSSNEPSKKSNEPPKKIAKKTKK